MAWNISPGETIVRKELHNLHGGQRQGGIATPSNNILIFTDPSTGEQHDYHDTWIDTPTGRELHYAGEGQPQHGDQQMIRGNKAILEHRETGRPLRVFYGSKGTVEYAGEFELADDEEPAHYRKRVVSANGSSRSVIMFRLRPVGELVATDAGPARPLTIPHTRLSSPYRRATVTRSERSEPFAVDPDVIDRGLQGHVDTQNQLEAAAAAAGMATFSPGPADLNFDLAWRQMDGTVFVAEVKSLTASNQTGQIRLGLGQILDYAHALRNVGEQVVAVLAVEAEPQSGRWLDVCASVGVQLVWPETFAHLFT